MMQRSAKKTLRVLVFGQRGIDDDLTEWAHRNTDVHRVETFDAALEALRTQPFDLILASAADFVPFKDVHFSSQAAAIIDSVSQGVCIVGESGNLVWANPRMLGFEDEVREHVCQCCTQTFAGAQSEPQQGSNEVRGRRFSFATNSNQHYEVTATPVIDLHHRITQVAAVVRDVTNARRLQSRLDAIDQAGRELVSLDAEQFARLDAIERLSLLEQRILRCTKDLLHFENFEVRVLNKETNKLELVLASGMPNSAHEAELYASTQGNGICGYVAARGRSYICPDTENDPRYIPCVENARSSLTVPLRLHDRVVGVANFESTEPAAFGEDHRQFAEILAGYIALALHILELLVTERRTTTGRLGSDVMSEITAPLNDILTDVEGLVEDYIGHDDLRHRLRQISDNAVSVRETIKELTSTNLAVTGTRITRGRRKDPLLAGKRILVVDDEEMIRETVRDVLVGYGCVVSSAENGGVAVNLLRKRPFDLVLSDIKMPEKDGYQVFAAAKDANPKTPVILTTGFGYDPNHAIVRARREGLAAVLFKPFKVDQLLNEIRTALK